MVLVSIVPVMCVDRFMGHEALPAGIGGVHEFTVGDTNPLDPTQFDGLPVFTGKSDAE